jgi:arsenical-resistance protein 2
MTTSNSEPPWYVAYPIARTRPASITRQELLQLFEDGKELGKDFILVDLRRTDFDVCGRGQPVLPCALVDLRYQYGGSIRGSINLPPKASIQPF